MPGASSRCGTARLIRAALAIAIASGFVGLVAAAPARAGPCSGALGLSSESIYRGISQSEGRASAFGDLHCALAQDWIVGLGANAIRAPSGRSDTQLTAYLDRRWRLDEDWSAKLGLIHYEPMRAGNRAGFQYDELNAALGWRGRWLLAFAWSPRVGNAYIGDPAGYNGWMRIETTWRQPLGAGFSMDLGLGHAHPSGTPPHDYRYANLALNAAIGDVYLSINRIWTGPLRFRYEALDPPFEFTFPARQRWVGSVAWVF